RPSPTFDSWQLATGDRGRNVHDAKGGPMRPTRDAGSATPLALIVVALATTTIVAVGHTGRGLVDRQQAQAAADAVALAAAASRPVARPADVAAANGAVIVALDDHGVIVDVIVRVGSVTATARAERATALPRRGSRWGSLHSAK